MTVAPYPERVKAPYDFFVLMRTALQPRFDDIKREGKTFVP